MGTSTEQTTDAVSAVEELSLGDPIIVQMGEQSTVLMSAGDALLKSKLLEGLINDADSRIGALVYFFFGSEGERRASSVNPTAIPKLTH